MRKVAVLFLNGGAGSTAVQPVEIFSNAGVFWNLLNGAPLKPAYEVTTATVDGAPARIDPLISITPERSFAEIDKPDLIFVPAGGLELNVLKRDGYVLDAVLEANAEAIDWLKRWASEGVKIAAVCSGVALVAEAGLLDGKSATAHWGLADRYKERFPAVDWRPEFLVTDAGDICCGGGVNAASDVALYLVEKHYGREIALQCARALLIEMPRTWQNTFTHFGMGTPHQDSSVEKAQHWLQQHYAEDVCFEKLAADLGMSARNFARRFKEATGASPLSYLHGLRVATAKQLLENSGLQIQEIANRAGYQNMIFFRQLFKRHTGVCPNDYRRRFGDGNQLSAVS